MRFFGWIAAASLLATLVSCGVGGDGSGKSDGASVSLSLLFPDGAASGCATCAKAPDYVTGATLTITGDLLANPLVQNIPLDTGIVEGTLTPGTYTFSILVTTRFGDTFTGVATVFLVSGPNSPAPINLAVNAPPSVDGLTFTPTAPLVNQNVTFTATVSDRDNDPLTATWRASGGKLSAHGLLADWTTPFGGAFTITLTVSDGKGGTASRSAKVTVPAYGTPNPTATGGNQLVTIDWSTLSGVLSYDLYWSNTAGVTVATGTKIANVTPPYQHTGLAPGTTYYYIVTANFAGGNVNTSAEVSGLTLPDIATGLTCAAGYRQLALNWNATAGATGYTVYWANATGVTTASASVNSGTNSYTQTSVPVHQTRYYKVAATNATGAGPLSTEVNCQERTGLTWTNRGTVYVGKVVHDGASFWIGDASGAAVWPVKSSANGAAWSAPTVVGGANDSLSVLYWTGSFLIGGNIDATPLDGYFTSATGAAATWTQGTISACGAGCPTISGLVGSGNTILAGLTDGTHAVGTYNPGTNTVAWGAIANTAPATTGNLRGGVKGPAGVYVMVSASGDMVTYNGAVWARPQNVGQFMYAAAYGGGLYVAVGDNSTAGTAQIWTSPNSTAWTNRATTVNQSLRDVLWTGNGFMAVGNQITFSSDGITWEAPFGVAGAATPLASVAYDGTRMVMVDSAGTVFTSP